MSAGSGRSARSSCRRRSEARSGLSSSPKTCCASAAAAAGTEAGLSPIAVSTRARRPACSAWRKRRSSSGPVGTALERVTHLARGSHLRPERASRALRRRGTGAMRHCRRRAGTEQGRAPAPRPRRARAGMRSRARRGRIVLVAGEIDLGPVARREDDRLTSLGEIACEPTPRLAARGRRARAARWVPGGARRRRG